MKNRDKLFIARMGCSAGVILISILIAAGLILSRPRTRTVVPQEPVLAVNLLEAQPVDLTVHIETQGVVKSLRNVNISSQVGGKVLHMPRELKAGDLVEKDELLLKIDPSDYENQLAEAQASVSRLEAGLELIRIQEASNREQLQLAERSRDLARKEFERARRLSEEGQAVSEAVVESSERSLTQAETQVLQLRQALALVPGQILETESGLKAARAGVEQARLQLARTAIRSPLSGRIVLAQVEQAEVLQPGQMIFEIAEDSRLEIEVPVTAADLRNWIPFAQNPSPALRGWFAPLLPVPVEIRWSESSSEALWEGELNRIVRFDATTRTAMLAVRIPEEKLITHATGLPLSEGMFCQVRIPGKELKQVFAVPRSAVTFDNKCYLYVDGRLKTVEVSVARSEGDITYISGGIQPGDQVIITRLVAPLEGVKLVEAE